MFPPPLLAPPLETDSHVSFTLFYWGNFSPRPATYSQQQDNIHSVTDTDDKYVMAVLLWNRMSTHPVSRYPLVMTNADNGTSLLKTSPCWVRLCVRTYLSRGNKPVFERHILAWKILRLDLRFCFSRVNTPSTVYSLVDMTFWHWLFLDLGNIIVTVAL